MSIAIRQPAHFRPAPEYTGSLLMEIKLAIVAGEARQSDVTLQLPALIGRSRHADVTLAHPMVSRRHCELNIDDDRYVVVEDLGSVNGTYVGHDRIESATRLEPGELLTIGVITFRADYGDYQTLKDDSVDAIAHIEAHASASHLEANVNPDQTVRMRSDDLGDESLEGRSEHLVDRQESKSTARDSVHVGAAADEADHSASSSNDLSFGWLQDEAGRDDQDGSNSGVRYDSRDGGGDSELDRFFDQL